MAGRGVDGCPLIAAKRIVDAGREIRENGDQWRNPYLTEWIDRATYRLRPLVLLTTATQKYLPRFDIAEHNPRNRPLCIVYRVTDTTVNRGIDLSSRIIKSDTLTVYFPTLDTAFQEALRR